MADRDDRTARALHPSAARPQRRPPVTYADALRILADDVPAGPWQHRRSDDGALLLEDLTGEPLAQIYAGLPLARYLEACAPAVLFGEGGLGELTP